MNLDATTFLFETLNFFILLWILRHFLYRPILEVIESRRQRVEAQMCDAEAKQAEALAARQHYDERLAAWEAEKARALQQLTDEIGAERVRRLAAVQQETAETRARLQAQDAHEREELQRHTETAAMAAAGVFLQKLLGRLAGPELESRLVAMALSDWPELPDDVRSRLREAVADQPVEVLSAYPLPDGERAGVTSALTGLAGQAVDAVFREEPALIAGLRIQAGSWVMGANLRDELAFFRDLQNGG